MDVLVPELMAAEVSTGTTILALEYSGGVVLGADSRTSTGTYVSNRASDKITALTDNIYMCRSGSAADTQVISDYVRYFLHQHVIRKGEPAEVKTAASLSMHLAYENKKMLQAGMIIAGWDKRNGGTVYALPLGGTLLKVPFAIGGSGSTYITGYCDEAFKEGMTKEQAHEFVIKAVALAMARDGSSGGVIRLVTIDESGVERKYVPGNEVPIFFEEIRPIDSIIPPGGTGLSHVEPMAAT